MAIVMKEANSILLQKLVLGRLAVGRRAGHSKNCDSVADQQLTRVIQQLEWPITEAGTASLSGPCPTARVSAASTGGWWEAPTPSRLPLHSTRSSRTNPRQARTIARSDGRCVPRDGSHAVPARNRNNRCDRIARSGADAATSRRLRRTRRNHRRTAELRDLLRQSSSLFSIRGGRYLSYNGRVLAR